MIQQGEFTLTPTPPASGCFNHLPRHHHETATFFDYTGAASFEPVHSSWEVS